MLLNHVPPALSSDSPAAGDHNTSSLLGMLDKITDPRGRRGRRHKLAFVLAAVVVAVLAGAANARQVADEVADLPQKLLRTLGAKWSWFKKRYATPSASTIRRVLRDVDPHEVDLAVGAWLFERARRDGTGLLEIALDAKVLRGAWTDEDDQFTLLSAMIHREGVVIGQIRVPADTTETTQVEAFLKEVPLEQGNTILTADAAHTQRETAAYMKEKKGADYLLAVKGNQPGLQEAVFAACLPLVKSPGYVVEERSHGRIKRWETWVADAAGVDFPHAEQVACIRRDEFTLDGVRISKEYALAVTSAPAGRAGPAEVHTYARGHWGIENLEHRVRDTVWEEDDNQSYVGNTQHTMAALRNLVLGLFRLNGIHKIKAATERIRRDRTRALPLLATQRKTR
jgi:predicted transposase YbfD/YdcC